LSDKAGGLEDGESGAADGRRRRSQRTRDRILAAVVDALRDPDLEVSPEAVAARSGVSLSTIFRHFGDMQGLGAAAREHVAAQVIPLMLRPFDAADFLGRVRELVARRAQVFEIAAPLWRVAVRQARGSTGLADRDEHRVHEALHNQLVVLLDQLEGERADDVVCAIDALLSPDTWLHLRHVQELDAARAAAVLESAVCAILEQR
jgi:AcrR family transcriptional regulator